MANQVSLGRKAQSVAFWAGCFVAPIALLVAACVWNGVYPFGAESFLTEDIKYQYVDLFTWFRKVIYGQTSALYLANTGLGANSWGLVGYYLSSPFNVLLFFFDEDHLTEFFWLITALKLGCIQVTTVWYLLRRFQLPRWAAFALALGFTWSLWTATQLRNPLWLDALILLPLAAYATFLLIRQRRWLPLMAALAASVIICWYTAYMTILFLCLYAILELIAATGDGERYSVRDVAIRVGLFSLAVAVALLVSAFTFVPTVAAMLGGRSGGGFDGFFIVYLDSVASGFFLGGWQNQVTPQLWAGSLVALLAVSFFLVKSVPCRTKVAAGALLVFMVVSTFAAPLFFVWSGFRMPAGFYCRITFLTIFVALWMAAAAFRAFQTGDRPVVSLAVAAGVIVVAAAAVVLKGWLQDVPNALLGVALAVVYAALLIVVFKRGCGLSRVVCIVLKSAVCVIVFVELLYGAHLAWLQLYVGYEQQYHWNYVAQARDQLAELEQYDDGLYRVEKTYTRAGLAALNEGATRGYLAVSTYLSSQDIAVVTALEQLGYSNEGEFSVRYASPIIATDSLLGVKYVSSDSQPAGYVATGLMQVDGAQGFGAARFYRNPYALPLGYGVSDEAAGFRLPEFGDPFQRQNALVSALVGEDVQLYRPLEATVVDETESSRAYEVTVPEGQIGYVYSVVPAGGYMMLSVDGRKPVIENWQWQHSMVALGAPEVKDTVRGAVLYSVAGLNEEPRPLDDDAVLVFYALDVQEMQRVLDKLAESPVSFSVFESGHIEASYQAEADGYALITVPAAAGWTVQVNGQQVEVSSACNGAFTLVPVTAGDNEIVMTYVSPGLLVGCVVSAVTLVALAVYLLVIRRRAGGRVGKHVK